MSEGVEAAFVGDMLVVDAHLGRSRLSPSVAKSMHGCPARWALEQIVERPDDPFGAAEQGTAAHWVLEQLYGLAPAERTVEAAGAFLDEAAGGGAGQEIILPGPDGLQAWRDSVWELIGPVFTVEDPTRVEVVGREKKLDGASVAAVPFRGIIDRIDRLPGGGLRIVDYKTSRKGLKDSRWRTRFGDPHGDQLRFYAHALEELGERVDQVSIIYTATGQVYDAAMGPDEMGRVADEFAGAWRALGSYSAAGLWPTEPSGLCGWCFGCSVCPAAAKAGRGEPKVPAGFAAGRAGVGVVGAPHTVMSGEGRSGLPPEQEGKSMQVFSEQRRWEEQDGQGRLNADSPAAQAAFGFAAKATELLSAAGVPLTRSAVSGMARTLAHVVDTVQADVYGQSGLMVGVNTRLRGALWTAIGQYPMPFGGSGADWDEWVENVSRRTRSIALVAFDLWAHGPGSRPWEHFSQPTVPAEPEPVPASL